MAGNLGGLLLLDGGISSSMVELVERAWHLEKAKAYATCIALNATI